MPSLPCNSHVFSSLTFIPRPISCFFASFNRMRHGSQTLLLLFAVSLENLHQSNLSMVQSVYVTVYASTPYCPLYVRMYGYSNNNTYNHVRIYLRSVLALFSLWSKGSINELIKVQSFSDSSLLSSNTHHLAKKKIVWNALVMQRRSRVAYTSMYVGLFRSFFHL